MIFTQDDIEPTLLGSFGTVTLDGEIHNQFSIIQYRLFNFQIWNRFDALISIDGFCRLNLREKNKNMRRNMTRPATAVR